MSLYLAYSAPFFKFLKLALPTPHDADALSLRGCSCCGLVPDPTTSSPRRATTVRPGLVSKFGRLMNYRPSGFPQPSSHAAESAPPPLCGYRLPLVVPEHPWDGRAIRPPLANVAAKSTSAISVPSCGSRTRLGLWQLKPNYPRGALTKECAATRCTKPTRHHPPNVGPFKLALSAPRHAGTLTLRNRGCLPLGPVRLSIGADAAAPRTHDIPWVP